MQELIAIIASTVIGATIILMLAVIAWRGQNHTTSSVQYSAAKSGVLDFAEVIEEDLGNMGAGQSNAFMRANYGGFTSLSSYDSTATPGYLEFYSWTDRNASVSNAALNPSVDYNRRVRYEWSEVGTAQVFDYTTRDFVAKPTFIIRRFVDDGSGSLDPAGSSIDTLTEIVFRFYNIDGIAVDINAPATTAELHSVRAIEVALAAASPLGGGTGFVDASDIAQRGDIDQARWVRRFRPPNLIRVTN